MKNSTKKTAIAVVGILSAVAVGSGAAALNATNPAKANENVAYAAEAVELQGNALTYVNKAAAILTTVEAIEDDAAYYETALAVEVFLLNSDYLNLTNAEKTAVDAYALNSTKYATVGALRVALEGKYNEIWATVTKLQSYVEGFDDAMVIKGTLLSSQEEAVLADVAAYTGMEANKKAVADAISGKAFKPVANIATILTNYYAGLNEKIAAAKTAVDNVYKNTAGEIVLKSAETLATAKTALMAIYGTEDVPSATDSDKVKALVDTYNGYMQKLSLIGEAVDAVAGQIDAIYAEFNADTNCYTYEVDGVNQVDAAVELYEALSEDEDNDEKAYFNTKFVDTTKANLDTMKAAYIATYNAINGEGGVVAKIGALTAYEADILYTKGDEIAAVRTAFSELPSEISGLTDAAVIAKYVSNYAVLVAAESTLSTMQEEVATLQQTAAGMRADLAAGKFSLSNSSNWMDAVAKLTPNQQKDLIEKTFTNSLEKEITYQNEVKEVAVAYNALLEEFGDVKAAIDALTPADEVSIEDKAAIEEVGALILTKNQEQWLAYFQASQDAYDERKEALDVVTANLTTWEEKVAAIMTAVDGKVEKVNYGNKEAIDDVINYYTNTLTDSIKTYIGKVTAADTTKTAKANYDALNLAMYGDSALDTEDPMYAAKDGVYTVVRKVAAKMDVLNVPAANADAGAVATFKANYAAAKAAYEPLLVAGMELSKAALEAFPATEGQTKTPFQKYTEAGVLGIAYDLEAKIELINKAFDATAADTDYATGTFDVSEVNLSKKGEAFTDAAYTNCVYNIDVLNVIAGQVDQYHTDYAGKPGYNENNIRNEVGLLDALMAKRATLIAKYEAVNNDIRVAMGNKAAEGAEELKDTRSIELTGTSETDPYFSIASIKAAVAALVTEDAETLGYLAATYHFYLTEAEVGEDDDTNKFVLETAEKAIMANIEAVNTTIAEITSGADVTLEQKNWLDQFVRDTLPIAEGGVYAETQKALFENLDKLTSIQGKTKLADYITATINEIVANVEAGEYTKDGYATAQVMQAFVQAQDSEIRALVGLTKIDELDAAVAAYAEQEVLVGATDILAALEAAKKEFTDAIADTNGALAEAVADIENLAAGIAQNGADIDVLEENVADIVADVESITSDIDGMNSEIAYLQTTIQEAIAAYDANAIEGTTLADVLADANAKLAKVTADLAAAKDALAAKDAELQVAIAAVDAAVKALDAEYSAFVAKYDVELAGVKTSITEIKSDVEKELATVSAELEATKKALEEKDAQLQTEINKLSAELKSALATLAAKDEELEEEINVLKGALDELKSSLTATIIVFSVLLAGAAAAIVLLFLKKQGK